MPIQMQQHEIFRHLLKSCDLTAEQAAKITNRTLDTTRSYSMGRLPLPPDVWSKIVEYASHNGKLKIIMDLLDKHSSDGEDCQPSWGERGEPSTPMSYHAAMFKHLGDKTKISRVGHAIIFTTPQLGRHDLSDNHNIAAAQLAAAGIDVDDVTPDDITLYESWYDKMYQQHKILNAHIRITRPFTYQEGKWLKPARRVSLIDGWGNLLDMALITVDQGEAVRDAEIDAAIEKFRTRHPLYAHAPISDGRQEGD